MSFALELRDSPTLRFTKTPALLQAIYSARLGSRGAAVLSFKEQSAQERLAAASSNVNFASDFSSSATLPPPLTSASTYDDIIDALHGLAAFAAEFCWDHVRSLVARLRQFVAKNKSYGNDSQERVTLTLQFVDQFLGRALAHLQSESTSWWANYCNALRDVEYESKEWTMALVELQQSKTNKQQQRQGDEPVRRNTFSTDRHRDRQPQRQQASSGVPDELRRLIPRTKDGKQPCLRFAGGGMCSGTRDQCDSRYRHHDNSVQLDPSLLKWATERYGRRN